MDCKGWKADILDRSTTESDPNQIVGRDADLNI
jgi:hypothetical protein